MPPYPISVIDDSDDFVDLPRGHIGGRATVMASNPFKAPNESGGHFETGAHRQPVAYIHDSQGRKSHSLTRAADSVHDFASAIDTNSEVGGEPALPTRPTFAKTPAALINPNGKQHEKKANAKKVAFEDEIGADHAEKDDGFFFGDMDKKEAFGNMMGKAKKVQNTGKLLSPDGKYKVELHRVDGDETHSLLGSAIDDSSEIMDLIEGLQAIRPQPARLEECSVASAQSSGRAARNTQQQGGVEERPNTPARASANAAPNSSASDELRRQAIHHNATLADHIGGIPVMTRPRPAAVLVAHELNDEERQAIEPVRGVRIPFKYVRQPPPRIGVLIPHRNGDIGLVHDKGPALINRGVEQRRTWSYSRERTNSPRDSRVSPPGPAHAPVPTNGAGPVRIPGPIRAPAAIHTSVSARPPAPTCAPAPVRAPAPAPGPTPATTSNYHSPTVESTSDTGDLAGLFG
ncbi:Sac3 ganp family protein [Neofusicoccum parvum]|uniref:Sac3 ganp family protein n=1 Tax=Neofusicoccum parvum TaxID=310453 RepID=A0ACB5RZG4_9PEZI|nr:Sac3 ganp family protein [Neofusicoccum parvum]